MLLPFFEWCEGTFVGTIIRESVWAFPVIEAIHLLGLCVLGGAVLIVDMRMFGLGLTNQKTSEVSLQARPWLNLGVAVMVCTGLMLFLSEAIKCYYNTSFWVKVTTLPVALLFTYLVRERVARRESEMPTTKRARLVAGASVTLWFVVAAAGRWIGFS
jgi:hypothetical protein